MDYRNKPPIQEYYLTHHGIRGQKWGKRNGPPYPLDDSDHSASEKKAGWRKSLAGSSRPESQTTTSPKWGLTEDRLSLKTKSGESITLKEHPSSRMASFLARHSKRVAEEAEKTAMFDIKGPDGKNVGDITLYKESPTSINVVWVTTSTKVRGRGYGTAVMKAAIQIAKDTGANTVTLEVPGSSPDARHIYEKLGFKEVESPDREVESPDREVDDVWGGLTNMRLDLDQVRHSYFLAHSSGLVKISKDVAKRYASFLVKEIESFEGEAVLSHHGIKGQRWGVRRYQNADGTLTAKGKARLEKKDNEWINKRSEKITEKAQKKSAKELNQYATALLQTPGAFNKNGKLSAAAIAAYNRKMSELMSQKVSDLRTPSGKVVKFVAKRGEIGVMMALADAGYDMDQLKKGVWASGRVAYKKTVLDKV